MIHDIDALFEGKWARFEKFCNFGSSSKQSSSQNQQQAQVSSNTIDPLQMQQYQQNYDSAKTAAASLTPYSGQMVAGFNPTQQQAQGIFSGIGLDNSNQSAINKAIGSVQGILGNIPNSNITPRQVNANPITAANYSASTYNPTSYDASTIKAPDPYSAAQLSGTDLSPYYDPFQKSVIDASIAQNGYARDQQAVKDNAAATAAGAFGGTRQAVQRAETSGAYDRNDQQNLAALNAANFTQAREGALADIGARNTASQFNRNMDFNVGNANAGILNSAREFGANAANQAGQFNAGSANQAGQFNAGQKQSAATFNSGQDFAGQQFNSGQDMNAQQTNFSNTLAAAGLTLNAAGQIIPLSQASLADASSRAGILGAVGDQQQQQQQNELAAAYQSYMSGQQLTLTQQQLLSQALGMIPIEQTTNSNGTSSGTSNSQTSTNPGLGGILGGIGSLFSSVSALGGLGGLGGGNGLPGGLGAGSSGLGQMTGSNAVGYGGIFGAAAPQAQAFNIPFPSFNPSSVSLPRLS